MNLLDSILNEVINKVTKYKSSDDLTALLSELKSNLHQAIHDATLNNDVTLALPLIKNAFKSAQNYAEKVFPQIWDEILDRKVFNLNDLSRVIYDLADDLNENSFQTLLESLVKKNSDLIQLVHQAALFCLNTPGDTRKCLSHIWGPLLSAVLTFSGPEKIAAAISSVITSNEEQLNRVTAFRELDLISPQAETQVVQKILQHPEFQLPGSIILSGLGLQYLIQKTDFADDLAISDSSNKAVRGIFAPIIQSLHESDAKSPPKLDHMKVIQIFMELIKKSKEKEDLEWALLKMARFAPVGIFLILAAILYHLVTHPLPWWDLLFKEIETDPALKVKRLPAPTKNGPKYLIMSDIHRDARSDRREPLEFGSIDHFSANQSLYCEILDYAIENGITVIEAGDCDELWYHRDFSRRPKEKLEEIVATHQIVYDRLIKLHHEGRYVRLYGNHDDYVRKPEIFQVLQKLFDKDKKPEAEPFNIYDFAIIDEIKSMDESIINFGLDSEPYKLKLPLIIAHGHQWDFWNCDQNNIIGKLIVSAIATPIDFLDDPFVDAGGIAYSGSPVINFADITSKAFIVSNFPAYLPARKFAHFIQHLDNAERQTVDDIYFLETLAALSAATIAVRRHSESHELRRMNLICLGHTHFPQSQPYFNLKKLLPFVRPLIDSWESKISNMTHGIIKPDFSLIKSRYFNSGTAGWMEGVIWAIQIDETGQARLVYWTCDTRIDRPQMMDWELPLMDDDLRNKLEVKKGSLLNTIETLSTYIDPLIDSSVSSVIRSLAAPFEALLGLFGNTPAANLQIESSESLATPLLYVFFSLLGAEDQKTHTFRIVIPDETRNYLSRIENFLSRFPEIKSKDRTRLACAWFLASQSIPFLGANQQRSLSPFHRLPNSNSFLQAILGLIVSLPGDQNEFAPIRSHVKMERNEFIIQITTRPVISQRVRAFDIKELLDDQVYEQRIRPLWKNMIRLPDTMVFS